MKGQGVCTPGSRTDPAPVLCRNETVCFRSVSPPSRTWTRRLHDFLVVSELGGEVHCNYVANSPADPPHTPTLAVLRLPEILPMAISQETAGAHHSVVLNMRCIQRVGYFILPREVCFFARVVPNTPLFCVGQCHSDLRRGRRAGGVLALYSLEWAQPTSCGAASNTERLKTHPVG